LPLFSPYDEEYEFIEKSTKKNK